MDFGAISTLFQHTLHHNREHRIKAELQLKQVPKNTRFRRAVLIYLVVRTARISQFDDANHRIW